MTDRVIWKEITIRVAYNVKGSVPSYDSLEHAVNSAVSSGLLASSDGDEIIETYEVDIDEEDEDDFDDCDPDASRMNG